MYFWLFVDAFPVFCCIFGVFFDASPPNHQPLRPPCPQLRCQSGFGLCGPSDRLVARSTRISRQLPKASRPEFVSAPVWSTSVGAVQIYQTPALLGAAIAASVRLAPGHRPFRQVLSWLFCRSASLPAAGLEAQLRSLLSSRPPPYFLCRSLPSLCRLAASFWRLDLCVVGLPTVPSCRFLSLE